MFGPNLALVEKWAQRSHNRETFCLESLLDKIVPKQDLAFNKLFRSAQIEPPWRIPSASICPKWEQINMILQKSMEIQSSTIPGTPFGNFIMSNSCLPVCGLLQYYLKSLNICKDAKVVHGILLWPEEFDGYHGKATLTFSKGVSDLETCFNHTLYQFIRNYVNFNT